MRKIKFGFGGRGLPIPWKVQKIVDSLKYLLGIVSGAEFIIGNPSIAFWILLSGAFMDELSKYFYEE